MMTKEDLQKFVNSDRETMNEPFSLGDYTYATNGHILVRVPRLADVPEKETAVNSAAKLFDEIGLFFANFVEIPELPKNDQECRTCGGTGKVSDCPECDGDGAVVFRNDYNDYECECLTCYGYGAVSGGDRACDSCNGTGKVNNPTSSPGA